MHVNLGMHCDLLLLVTFNNIFFYLLQGKHTSEYNQVYYYTYVA